MSDPKWGTQIIKMASRSSYFVATRADKTSTFYGDITMKKDLTIEGEFLFGDVAADTLTMNGEMVWGATAPTYCIDMNASTPGTGDLRFSNGATVVATSADILTISESTVAIDGLATFGTFAIPKAVATAIEQLIMISGNVTADLESGVTRCAWFRAKVSDDQTGNSIMGIEAQCRINGAASSANTLGAGQFTGCWAYWEQSGTTALNTGNLSSAVSCTIESASTLTIDSGAILAGVVIDSSLNASTTNNGTVDAIYIKKSASAMDFASGIEMTDCISGEILKLADDETICNDTGATGTKGTATIGAFDGFVKIKIGNTTTYLLTVNDPTASS